VRPGIWQLTCGDEIDIIGEQQLIDAMTQRGWILNESIIEDFSHDPAHETIDMTSKLESDALASLTQVCA